MKNLTLLLTIVFLSCQHEKKLQVIISNNNEDSVYFFKIWNNEAKTIFILEDYDDVVIEDSIIFEPSFTFRGPNNRTFFPNVFYAPKMIAIKNKNCYLGRIRKTHLRHKSTDPNFFLRVYELDFNDYVDSVKVIPYVHDFIKFQDGHSKLIKGRIVDKSAIENK